MLLKREPQQFKVLLILLMAMVCNGHLKANELSSDFQPISFEAQIETIRRLAANGYEMDAEESGKALLGYAESERICLLELLGSICIQRKHYRQVADYYLQAWNDIDDKIKANRYLILMGDAYYKNRDYSLAAMIYGECNRQVTDDAVLLRYGNALLHSGISPENIKCEFQQDYTRAKFNWNCAVFYFQRNDFKKAIFFLAPLISQNQLGLSVHYFYAWMQYQLGNFHEAIRMIELGEQMYYESGMDELYYRKLLMLRLGIAIEQNDDFIAANTEYILCSPENSDLGKILLRKVAALRRAKRYEEALYVLKKLKLYLPHEAQYLKGEIYCNDVCGKIDKALKIFKTSGEGEGQIALMGRLRQADAECSLGNFSRAEMLYKELQKALKDEKWLRQKDKVREYLNLKISRTQLAQRRFDFLKF